MKFTASSALLAGAALLSTMSAVSADGFVQASVKPLVTRPGGIVTVTMNFVVNNLDDDGRRLGMTPLPPNELIKAGASTYMGKGFGYGFAPEPETPPEALKHNNDTKNHTKSDKHGNKHGDDFSITIKSAKISPNNFRPKESAEIKEEEDGQEVLGETASFVIDEDDVIQDKEYRITYKIRIGKGFESGEVIDIPVAFEGPNMFLNRVLEVLVK